MYVCFSADFCRYKAPGNRLTPGVCYLKIAYGQTAGVCNNFPAHYAGVTNMFPHYNLSHAAMIYRRHWRLRSSSRAIKTTDLIVYCRLRNTFTYLLTYLLTWPMYVDKDMDRRNGHRWA